MFYDKFSEEQICGLFSTWHFVAMACFAVIATLLIFLSRKTTEKHAKIILLVIAIMVTIMEIVKIVLRAVKGDNPNSYIPLYFCSLFLYAIWFIFSKNMFIQNTGYSFLVFGGIFASVAFVIYPSTSLMLYPIWHPGSLHSLFYHLLMFYSGVLVLQAKLYQPKAKHFWNYFAFTAVCCVVAIIINRFVGTNMMFLNSPFGLPVLEDILKFSKVLYILIASLAQCVLLFWSTYGVYVFCHYIKRKTSARKKIDKNA